LVLEASINSDSSVDASEQENSFLDLIGEYLFDEPERGQILKATILQVRRDEVILDVGLKRDALVPRKDLERLPQDVIDGLEAGQEIDAYVLRPYSGDGELIVSINKALELEDWRVAQDLVENGDVVTGIVVDSNKGGLLVRFGRLMGFIPNSHIDSVPAGSSPNRMREIKEKLNGQELQLKVIQVESKRNRLIMSERAARRLARDERMQEINVGDVVKGTVVNLTDFGAFVDIGGLDGMIHISNIDHRHVNHPSDVLSIGDEIDVRIDNIDVERERIALNRKAILPDPWDLFMENYRVDDLVEGVVTNVVDFGVFIAAPGGAQGLVHTSRMSKLGASTPRDMFKDGDPVLVRVVGINGEQKHIEFSLDDVTQEEQEAWMHKRRGDDAPDAGTTTAPEAAD